jgi:beta-galactosidase/beta-glucuronidase
VPETTDLDHPRPQLVRDGWLDLCGEWGFAVDDADGGLAGRWSVEAAPFGRSITVPYPPESKLSGVGDRTVHPVVWYRREIEVERPGDGRRVLLHFGAVDYEASVWVNGQLVGSHRGGHTSFRFDITEALRDNGSQLIAVRAHDPADDPGQPRGKQDWLPEPHGIWYHRTTGIWQPVWIETVPQSHVEELAWTTDPVAGRVSVRAQVASASGTTLRVVLSLGDEVLADQRVRCDTDEVDCDIALSAARHGQYYGRLLWSPEHPTLLDARVSIEDGDGRVVDTVRSYVGLRSVGISDGRFLLNGLPYFLRLVLEQGYWPESHLAAPNPDALRREVELVKEMGFNGIRVHQKIEDPRLLAWCDRLGLLVWGEMPSAYSFGPTTVERVVAEWSEAVRRDRSHPCIVTWVPLNESWGVPHIAVSETQQHYATALYHLTKALDPTRPVISNDGWEHTESDIWGVHDYAAFGSSLAERYRDADAIDRVLHDRRPGRRRVLLGDPVRRGQPVVLTEFGGLSYAPAVGQEWFGYATVSSQEEYEERFSGLVQAVLDNPELAGFCYTQLTDTEQERNGLLTEDREPKLPLERIRAVVSGPARAIPSEEIDASRRQAKRTSDGADD